ncbi:DNA-binding protein [Corynebacterium tapiri]|uniref:DNA-binding protein n=2 Tax=Corynebacterium tapiri TaxID=1448266 RepID=A0A5C4U7J9_9CORY|nr:Rv2175c family DNA-binding protein [Corynebacterium tapiri]TNL99471.1 DNA-binding protein [Corynebacterium tapiri]
MGCVTKHDELMNVLAEETLLPLAAVGERLGVPVTKVGDLLKEHKLVALKVDGRKVVPEALLDDGLELNKFVASAISVLVDGGYDDEEILTYFFTPDDSLPGRPVDALHGHGAREVIRRAQAMAF